MSPWRHLRGAGRPSGFTLVEVLVVIAIVVVLAGMILGVASGVRRRAEVARTQGELTSLAQSLEQYRAAYGDYPWVATHAVDGAAALSNSQLVFQALLGHRSPIGDKVLRGGALQVRDDPLASLSAEQRRRFVDASGFSVGLDGEVTDPQYEPVLTAAGAGFFRQSFFDPWGQPYVYVYRAEAAPAAWQAPGYVLFSVGPDGLAGTVGGAAPVGPDGRLATGDPDDAAADNVYHAKP